MDIQTAQKVATSAVPVAWYWLAVASLALGMVAGSAATQGIKTWRNDHKQKAMLASEVRLTGRLVAGFITSISWVVMAKLNGSANVWEVWGGLALIAFMAAPWVWDNFERILRAVKPEWAAKL